MNILITGGAGFIGSNLIGLFLEKNYNITVLDNFSTGKMQNIREYQNQIEIIEGDILNDFQINVAAQKKEVVIHLAAMASVQKSIENPHLCNKINIDGTLNVLKAARLNSVKKVIFASSAAVYGNNPIVPKLETMLPEPMSPYAISKITGEYYCNLFSEIYNLQTVCFRFFNVYCPKQDPKSDYAAVIPIFISKLLNNQQPVIYGDGEQTRDFININDLGNAIDKVINTDFENNHLIVNLANGEKTSVNQLYKIISTILNLNIEPLYLPKREGDIIHSFADISKLNKEINFKPEINLEEGLKKTINYYLKDKE